jgi:hypothetical protein
MRSLAAERRVRSAWATHSRGRNRTTSTASGSGDHLALIAESADSQLPRSAYLMTAARRRAFQSRVGEREREKLLGVGSGKGECCFT